MPKEINTYGSRKRGAISTLTSYHDEFQEYSNSDETVDSADTSSKINDETYKGKYESICLESKKMKSELNKIKQRDMQLEEYAALLEAKNEILVKEIKQLKEAQVSNTHTVTSATSSSSDNNEKLESDLENTRKIVSFYELMTCMKVEYHPSVTATGSTATTVNNTQPKSNEYTCTIKNKVQRIATRFVLRTPIPNTATSQNLDFLPKANVIYLPEYLRAHVNFEATNAPVMMGDILLSLFNEEGTDEAD